MLVTIRLVTVVVPAVTVEEAWSAPLIGSGREMVKEPKEIEPPVKLARLATVRVEEACKPPATWRLPATVEEAWAINPPETVKAKTEVEAKFWTSRALPVWPSKVRSARLIDLLEVAPMVATALVETLEVPTTNWSVMVCNSTIAPVSVNPETLEAEMVPHKRLPVESVVRAEEPEQPVCNNCKDPPINWMPLEKVEVAAVPVMLRFLISIPPTKVEVPEPAAIIRSAEIVEEANKAPETWRVLETVEEPAETKPPPKVARLATDKVEEADNGPAVYPLLPLCLWLI